MTGIEPAYRAWEASVLPLNYTRMMRDPYSTQASLFHANAIPKNFILCFKSFKNGRQRSIDWVCQMVCKLRKIGPLIIENMVRFSFGHFRAHIQLIQITINGNPRSFEVDAMTIGALVEKLGLVGKRLAIECNGEIVPKSTFAEVALQNGDRLEIVGAVGGG